MKENELKSYDIASFDIELEYNKQTAPINKKIDRLNTAHETKSIRAHKDFLDKEKKSKDRLNQLTDKAVIKEQKIEKAVENKIIKLQAKERRIKRDFDTFVEEKEAIAAEEFTKINEVTIQLKEDETKDIDEIKEKYKTNIESYVEKLNIYNNNFDKNKQFHVEEIKKYQEQINIQLDNLKEFNEIVLSELEEKIKFFMEEKETHDAEINKDTKDATRVLSNEATNIRKRANVSIQDLEEYVSLIKKEYEAHLKPSIKLLDQEIIELKDTFEERRKLIEADLEMNLTKLDTQLETVKEEKNRKAIKNINMKMNLFNIRATTTLKYEERILNEKIIVLENEKKILEEQLEYELLNLDKLEIFLLNDQVELKDTGDYFRDLNKVLKTELNNYELANNTYLQKHEELKNAFIKNYTKIFSDLKQSTIELSQTYLEKIADNNFEIDEINKFLDTAEPLKEIEVNRLREDIEISEVQERFKIKYAKQDYETNIVQNQLDTDKLIREKEMKIELSEAQLEYAEIKTKEVYDKSLEKAKLKHSKAEEVYKLRLNNTKLERNLLTNKYETENQIATHRKELTEIEVRKHNALISKEIEYAIKNHEMEASYKIEVINKGLEEDLLKLEENVSKVKYEKDAYASNLNQAIDNKLNDINERKAQIKRANIEKLSLIDLALDREIKEPSRNILKTETIIDERLSKLDINNGIFVDFINDTIDDYKDHKLSLEQLRDIVMNNQTVTDKSIKYINRIYASLKEAVKFMNDIEKHAIMNQIAAASEQGKIKRYKKQETKNELENQKQMEQINTSEQDHVALITTFIAELIETVKRNNYTSASELVNNVEHIYNQVFTKLRDLQENIKKEIIVLYNPLTKNDQEIINHANTNADKAKALVEKEQNEAFVPLDKELNDFIEQKEQERTEFNQKYDTELSELRAEINQHKNEALAKVKEINDEKNGIIGTKNAQKKQIEETEDREIALRYEEIDRKLEDLTFNYNNTLQKLDDKDREAKKIFDYEDRIYNIAVESATSRYNDANVKSKNQHLNNIQAHRNNIDKANRDKENNLNKFNQELLDLTKSFEKNIFTVRPRLEESIGDAQKAIDKEINEKQLKLSELTERNDKIVLSAENSLYTTFTEGYDRLNNNLTNYIEKYRVIEEEYISDNHKSNNILKENNVTFSNALFEQSKMKHEKTLKELFAVNKIMLGEEDING